MHLIPVEYVVAMKLCSESPTAVFDLGAVLRLGKDDINGEHVRSILKSVDRQDAFDRYTTLLYDL